MLRIFKNMLLLAMALLVCHVLSLTTPNGASAQQPPAPEKAVKSDDSCGCDSAAACETGACCPKCGHHVCANGGCGKGRCGHGSCHATQVNCRERRDGQSELFYNYYMPGTCGGVPAALYVAPRPVPPVVGWTYYTYQPMMPHELLYTHHRTYYRYYDNGRGLTRTHISWYRPPVQNALGSLYNHFRLAR